MPSVGFDCINGIFEHTNIPIPVYGVAVPHSFIPPNSPYVGVTIQLPIGFTTGIITIMEDNTIIISNNVSGSGIFYEYIINNPGQRRFSIFLN